MDGSSINADMQKFLQQLPKVTKPVALSMNDTQLPIVDATQLINCLLPIPITKLQLTR